VREKLAKKSAAKPEGFKAAAEECAAEPDSEEEPSDGPDEL
jgi:hypothetical protein